MKNLFFLFLLFISNLCFAQYGSLKGKFVDGESKEPFPFANVILESGKKQVAGCTTDFDGKFHFDSILSGKYFIKINALTHYMNIVGEITIHKDSVTILYIEKGVRGKCSVQKTYEPIDIKYKPIQVIERIFTDYNKASESTDSKSNLDSLSTALKQLENNIETKDLELIINVWMYYTITDFPTQELTEKVLFSRRNESIIAVKDRIKNKEEWETEDGAPYSELKDLLKKLEKEKRKK